jgi:hypothetical protein
MSTALEFIFMYTAIYERGSLMVEKEFLFLFNEVIVT